MFTIPEKTSTEIARETLLAIDTHSVASVQNTKINYEIAFNMLWHTEGTTAQEICDQLGNQAYKLFENAMTWISLIQAFEPDWEYPVAPNEVTINQDGTVTIGDPITPEE